MGKQEQLAENLKTEWTPTEEVILKRRSVRAYKKEQVPEFMIKRILEAGRFAPSAGNGQPWKFRLPDSRKKMAVAHCKIQYQVQAG